MTEITAPPRFRQGSGRLCLDFVRTLRHRGTPQVVEELADGAALAGWVRQCGPAGDDLAATAVRGALPGVAEVVEARALREAVHALVAGSMTTGPGHADAFADGAGNQLAGGSAPPLDDDVRARLNRAAGRPVPTPRLTAGGILRWHADEPVPATLSLVARDALELATSPALLSRLRACASPSCGALFLDNSRPGTRRWCSMDTCGNRAKKSAFRNRTA